MIEKLINLNDWNIRKFLKFVIIVQLAMLGLIGLAGMGLNIPALGQIIGFIYLTFIPGALILRLFRLHKLGTIQTLLYTVGLSLTFLMFIGVFINTVLPATGISNPISAVPLTITVSVVILIMCLIAYWRDKDFLCPVETGATKVSLPPALLLILLPLLSFLGARLVDIFGNNLVSLLLMVLIAFVVVLIAFDKFIPRRMYPLAILMISIAFLVRAACLSPYLWGSDILIEHSIYKLVEINSYWDPNRPVCIYNAMLSDTMLPAMYHYLAGVDSLNIFKMIYPLIFSLVPLGFYQVYSQQIDKKTAFLSTFFFMSFPTFFNSILFLGKQQIGELLLICLLLLIIDKKMDIVKRSALVIIFSASLVTTHYALSYIYTGLIILSWLILTLYLTKKVKRSNLTGTYVSLLVIMALSWYMYISQSITFNVIVNIGEHVYTSIFTSMFASEARQNLILQVIGAQAMSSFLHEISRVVFWITDLFIAVGIGELIFKRFKGTKFEPEYIALSLVSMVFLFAAVALPYFVGHLNADRFYHIMLFFSSPFCILGGRTVFRGMSNLFELCSSRVESRGNLLVLIVLILYFLFQGGFIYEVNGEIGSIPLSLKRIEQCGDVDQRSILYRVYIHQQSVLGVKWLSGNVDNNEKIYVDYWKRDFVESYGAFPWGQVRTLNSATKLGEGDYIYLGYGNVVGGLVDRWDPPEKDVCGSEVLAPLIERGNFIYSNGGSEIHKFVKSK